MSPENPRQESEPQAIRRRSNALDRALPVVLGSALILPYITEGMYGKLNRDTTEIADRAQSELEGTFPKSKDPGLFTPQDIARLEAQCSIRQAAVICSNTLGIDTKKAKIGCTRFHLEETVQNAPNGQSVEALIERTKKAIETAEMNPDDSEIICHDDGTLTIEEIHPPISRPKASQDTDRLREINQKLEIPKPKVPSKAPQNMQGPIDPNRAVMRQFIPRHTQNKRRG